MIQNEIKELCAEELKLLERIQKILKKQPKGKFERIDSVRMFLLFRIYSNLYSSLLLTIQALKTKKVSFFQLPIGLLLRCCYTDCLFALYIQRIDKDKANEELDLRAIEYANSMLERKEVYRDQVKSIGKIFNDAFIDHMWDLTMEDNFLGLLTLDDNLEELAVTKQSKTQLKEEGFSKTASVKTRDVVDFLIGFSELKGVAMRLYNYWKYFSQYEHFSENAQGDVLASSKEDGNDNVHLPSAIKALGAGVEEMMTY